MTTHRMCDVIVLGAGPAGIPAALAAAETGANVTVVDANDRPGGQFHRQFPRDLEVARPGALHHGWRRATEGFAAVADHPRIEHLAGTRVWLVEPRDDHVIVHTTGANRTSLRARTLVLATGATERVLPFPGWDLPGVLTVGAAQALVKGQGVRPGHRVLVAGTGPLLLASASTLLAVGTPIAAVTDANGPPDWRSATAAGRRTPGKIWEAGTYLADLARARVPYRHRHAVIQVEGDGQVEHAVVARVDDGWHVIAGTEESFEVDAVCVSYGFTPNVGIAACLGCDLTDEPAVVVDPAGRTSVDRVFAAGEITGIAGASAAALEGAVAGNAAAHRAGFAIARAKVRRQARRRARHRQAAEAVLDAAPVRDGWSTWLDDDTIICRCEEATYGSVRHAIGDLGARDVRSVKMTTRCGMGPCQGAMCGPNVVDLVTQATGRRPGDATGLAGRSIAEAVTLGEL